jgi:hypothetical protein
MLKKVLTGFVALLPLCLLQLKCIEEPVVETVDGIELISPKGGETYSLSENRDTLHIICKSNYDDFESNIGAFASLDSGKNWSAAGTVPRGTGIETDTIVWKIGWIPDSVLTGQGFMVKVQEYDKKYVLISDLFFFE